MTKKEQLISAFRDKYGEGVEVKVPEKIMTIRDNCASPFSSGSNGYITKLRINKDTHTLEYWHD